MSERYWQLRWWVYRPLAEGDDPNPSSGAGQSALRLADVHLARFQAIFH